MQVCLKTALNYTGFSDLNKRCVALLQAVVEWDLFEVDLARLPEAFFTFLFLGRKKLGDVGIVALGHILMPALLHLITFHVVHIFHLEVGKCKKKF